MRLRLQSFEWLDELLHSLCLIQQKALSCPTIHLNTHQDLWNLVTDTSSQSLVLSLRWNEWLFFPKCQRSHRRRGWLGRSTISISVNLHRRWFWEVKTHSWVAASPSCNEAALEYFTQAVLERWKHYGEASFGTEVHRNNSVWQMIFVSAGQQPVCVSENGVKSWHKRQNSGSIWLRPCLGFWHVLWLALSWCEIRHQNTTAEK